MPEVESPPEELTYSFRCNNCQSLETSDHAGERDIPLKCRTCGKGAHYVINDAGAPELVAEPDNWTVLADLDGDGIDDVVSYHGEIKIAAHVPFKTTYVDGEQVTAPREGPEAEVVSPQFIVVGTEGHLIDAGDNSEGVIS